MQKCRSGCSLFQIPAGLADARICVSSLISFWVNDGYNYTRIHILSVHMYEHAYIHACVSLTQFFHQIPKIINLKLWKFFLYFFDERRKYSSKNKWYNIERKEKAFRIYVLWIKLWPLPSKFIYIYNNFFIHKFSLLL